MKIVKCSTQVRNVQAMFLTKSKVARVEEDIRLDDDEFLLVVENDMVVVVFVGDSASDRLIINKDNEADVNYTNLDVMNQQPDKFFQRFVRSLPLYAQRSEFNAIEDFYAVKKYNRIVKSSDDLNQMARYLSLKRSYTHD